MRESWAKATHKWILKIWRCSHECALDNFFRGEPKQLKRGGEMRRRTLSDDIYETKCLLIKTRGGGERSSSEMKHRFRHLPGSSYYSLEVINVKSLFLIFYLVGLPALQFWLSGSFLLLTLLRLCFRCCCRISVLLMPENLFLNDRIFTARCPFARFFFACLRKWMLRNSAADVDVVYSTSLTPLSSFNEIPCCCSLILDWMSFSTS